MTVETTNVGQMTTTTFNDVGLGLRMDIALSPILGYNVAYGYDGPSPVGRDSPRPHHSLGL
jgi:hypothetical protein